MLDGAMIVLGRCHMVTALCGTISGEVQTVTRALLYIILRDLRQTRKPIKVHIDNLNHIVCTNKRNSFDIWRLAC